MVGRKLRDVEILCLTLKATLDVYQIFYLKLIGRESRRVMLAQWKQSFKISNIRKHALRPFTSKANMDPGLKAEKVVEDIQGGLILVFALAAAI